MPDFKSTYQPPGVYIEEQITPLVSVIGIAPTVVGIVGPSVGYRTYTEAVTLTDTDPVTLSKLGVFGPASAQGEAFKVSSADGTQFTSGTDFTFAVQAGDDANVSFTQDNPSTLARIDGGGIIDRSTVYVTYRYQDADYNAPLRADDYDDVKDAFGEPLNLNTGEILSPLSLAAKLAFENGAREVVLVATTGTATVTTLNELDAAYTKLNSFADVNVVVPLPVGISGSVGNPGDTAGIGSGLRASIASAIGLGIGRIGILGMEKSVTVAPETLAAGINSSRVVLAWPNRMEFYNGFANQTLEVSGYYLAAAYAGRLASLQVQMPLTKKQIRGFSGIPAAVVGAMSMAVKNAWSDAGVAVTELTRDGRLVVRHGTSTDRTNIHTREVSLTRARDALVRLMEDTTERAQLVGIPITDETPLQIKGVIAGVLESAVTTGVIVSYGDLKARVQSIDPSVIEIKFQYRPAYPLNYIVISFSINTATGEVNVLNQAA